MRSVIGISIAFGVFFWCGHALAYRPFDSTDADVAGFHELEFEIGPAGYLLNENRAHLIVPAFIVNAGILQGWELVLEGKNRVGAKAEPGEPRDEIGDAALSLKTMLREGSMQDRPGLSVATEVGALLPGSGPDLGFGAVGALIVSHRLEIGAAHLNGGAFLGRTHHPGTFAGLILEGPFAWTVRPVAEGFFEREFGVETIATVLGGFIWRARENLSFDSAVRIGRASNVELVELRAGLTWGFEL